MAPYCLLTTILYRGIRVPEDVIAKPYFEPYLPKVTCPNAPNAVDTAPLHWGVPTCDPLYTLAHIVPIF